MSAENRQTEPPASLVLTPQRATEDPYTTSEIIAAGAGVQRRTVDHLLLAHKADFEEFGVLRFEMRKPPAGSKGGRPEIIYHLNEQQAMLLMTYLKNTEVVRAFKKELVRQFYAMRSLLLERASPIWQDARSLGKEIRRQETEAIKRLVDYAVAQGSRKARMYYVNLSKLADATVALSSGTRPRWYNSPPCCWLNRPLPGRSPQALRPGHRTGPFTGPLRPGLRHFQAPIGKKSEVGYNISSPLLQWSDSALLGFLYPSAATSFLQNNVCTK